MTFGKISASRPAVVFLSVAALLLVGYSVFIGWNFAPVAAGADSGGYLGSARLLVEGEITTPLRTVPEFDAINTWAHTPLGYEKTPGEDVLKPTYPIGLPLHYAVFGALAGWYWGPLFVSVLSGIAAILLCYRGLREFDVSPLLAAGGAATLGLSPLFIYISFIPMSDTLATAWCTAAFLAALWIKRNPRWAFASGFAFAMSVLVRPANMILLPVLLILFRSWRDWIRFGLAGLPGAIVNALYNQALWGNPFRSGYGTVVVEAFNLDFVRPSVANYLDTLPYALPLLFLGVLLLPWVPWRRHPREYIACVVWIAIFMVFYAFYEFTQQAWWFLRFLLPAFPAVLILACSGLENLLSRLNDARGAYARAAAAVLMVAAAIWGCVHVARERHFMLLKDYLEPYVATCKWTRQNLPPNSLVGCMQLSSSFYYYTKFPILRWDATDPDPFTRFRQQLRQTGRPFYAALFPFEEESALKTRWPGHWEKVTNVKDVTIWKYDPNR